MCSVSLHAKRGENLLQTYPSLDPLLETSLQHTVKVLDRWWRVGGVEGKARVAVGRQSRESKAQEHSDVILKGDMSLSESPHDV